MTAVKICGLTRPEDAALACALGAKFLGFNFIPSSPRRITLDRARELVAAAPAVLRVGVFADEALEEVRRAVETVPLDFVQLHRPVTREDVDGLAVKIFAAVRAEEGAQGVPSPDVLVRLGAVLFDSSEGTGRSLDPGSIDRRALAAPVLVAGGLTPENVGQAIRRLRPAGVDVASGVESAPGIKDRGKLTRFFAAVRGADSEAL